VIPEADGKKAESEGTGHGPMPPILVEEVEEGNRGDDQRGFHKRP
jgi:hypothetical protein